MAVISSVVVVGRRMKKSVKLIESGTLCCMGQL
jgi:hypothetical protein